MQAKTTPLLFLQDFAFKSNTAVLKTVMSFALLLAMVVSGYAQGLHNGRTIIETAVLPQIGGVNYVDEAGICPLSPVGKSGRSQYLYLADEFFSSTVPTDRIKKLALHLDVAGSLNFSNITIRIGYTNLTNFNSGSPAATDDSTMKKASADGFTTVYSSAKVLPSGLGWVEFNLDTPFSLTPPFESMGRNIIVEVAYTYAEAGYNPAINTIEAKATQEMYDRMSRGAYSTSTATFLNLTQGAAMFTYNTPSPRTKPAEEFYRDRRPIIKFTYEGNLQNSGSGEYSHTAFTYCDTDTFDVVVGNVYGTNVPLQWESSANDDDNFQPIPGAIGASVTMSQSKDPLYIRCRAVFSPTSNIPTNSTPVLIPAINTYSGTAWSRVIPPTASQTAYFTGNKSLTSDTEFCTIKVFDGAVVTVKDASTLRIGDRVVVEEGGELIFENNSSLIQDNAVAVNSGSIRYVRDTAPLNRYDFTYFSSPVEGATLYSVSPLTLFDKYFTLINNAWVDQLPSQVMKAGVGYIIRAPQTFDITGSTQSLPANFVGKPHNGDINVPVSNSIGIYNLIGNPYPSAVNVRLLLLQYQADLDGTIYLWNHAGAPSPTADANGIYQYSGTNYTSVNATGGTDGSLSIFKVAAGQSFMVKTTGTGTSSIAFKNSYRVNNHDDVTFYKTGNNPLAVQHQNDPRAEGRIWLELRGEQGKFQRMLIGYIEGASDEYDNGYDAEHMQASNLGFYAIAPNQNELGIMAKGLPFNNEDIIPIGYSATASGPMTIVKFEEDGLFKDHVVFLNDKLTNTLHNLSESAYDFTSGAGAFNSRFVLAFKPKQIQVVNPAIKPNTVVVFDKAELIQLHSTEQNIKAVIVYDMTGRIIAKVSNCDSVEVALSSIPRTNQLIVVETELENGIIETQKFQF